MHATERADASYGTLERREDGRWQLRFRRTLSHPIERVWAAVTEPEHLERWFPTTIEGERRAGAMLRFAFPDNVPVEPLDGEMLAFDPPWLMELGWGPDILRLELRSVSEGSELTLIHVLDELGKAARDGAGWHVCLDALQAALDEPDARAQPVQWNDVHPGYVERFGPEAATIGPPDGLA